MSADTKELDTEIARLALFDLFHARRPDAGREDASMTSAVHDIRSIAANYDAAGSDLHRDSELVFVDDALPATPDLLLEPYAGRSEAIDPTRAALLVLISLLAGTCVGLVATILKSSVL